MPKFGKRSKKKLATCHKDLQKVFNEVIKHIDCSVLEGQRNQERQDRLFKEGKTKVKLVKEFDKLNEENDNLKIVKYPDGGHNAIISNAVDITPYPVDWEDRERQTLFAGFVMGIAKSMGVNLFWGGDWDTDWQVQDNNFDDFPHFEIRK